MVDLLLADDVLCVVPVYNEGKAEIERTARSICMANFHSANGAPLKAVFILDGVLDKNGHITTTFYEVLDLFWGCPSTTFSSSSSSPTSFHTTKEREKGIAFREEVYRAAQECLSNCTPSPSSPPPPSSPPLSPSPSALQQDNDNLDFPSLPLLQPSISSSLTPQQQLVLKLEGEYWCDAEGVEMDLEGCNMEGEKDKERREMQGRKMRVEVWVKMFNRGKRDSQLIFLEYLRALSSGQPSYCLFLDSDTSFDENTLQLLYHAITESEDVGGVCAELEVLNKTKGFLSLSQYFEYKAAHFLGKSAETCFDTVLCLPGACSLFRTNALLSEPIATQYSRTPSNIIEANKLLLGEDRYLTTLLLENGWKTKYVREACAQTVAPVDVVDLVKQRRRWENSTLINTWHLLTSKMLWQNSRFWIPFIWTLIDQFISFISPSLTFLVLIFSLQRDAFITGIFFGILSLQVASFTLGCLWLIVYLVFILFGNIHNHPNFCRFIYFVFLVLSMASFVTFFTSFVFRPGNLLLSVSITGCIVLVVLSALRQLEILAIATLPLALISAPFMVLCVRLYAWANIDNVSWGTRGIFNSSDNVSQREAKQFKRRVFLLMLVGNTTCFVVTLCTGVTPVLVFAALATCLSFLLKTICSLFPQWNKISPQLRQPYNMIIVGGLDVFSIVACLFYFIFVSSTKVLQSQSISAKISCIVFLIVVIARWVLYTLCFWFRNKPSSVKVGIRITWLGGVLIGGVNFLCYLPQLHSEIWWLVYTFIFFILALCQLMCILSLQFQQKHKTIKIKNISVVLHT